MAAFIQAGNMPVDVAKKERERLENPPRNFTRETKSKWE